MTKHKFAPGKFSLYFILYHRFDIELALIGFIRIWSDSYIAIAFINRNQMVSEEHEFHAFQLHFNLENEKKRKKMMHRYYIFVKFFNIFEVVVFKDAIKF